MNFLSHLILLMAFLSCQVLEAQQNHDKTVRMTALVQESPAQITLNWLAPSSGSYVITHQKIYRRLAGQGWGGEYASLATGDLTYTDTNVEVGVLYEYRILRLFSNGPQSSTGYLETGIHLPEVDRRGSVILLVKDTAAAALATELSRLQEDLAGDGWHMIREDITGAQTVTDVKAIIKGHYESPSTPEVRSVFVFGRVPVPYSGRINPDGHTNHIGAWPADVFYGEMDGTWTDTAVNDTSSSGTRNDNIPGDGKYDQSVLPSVVELEVGRVDMANMLIFPDAATTENDLLLRYLNKNHDYRHLQGNYAVIPRRGLMDGNFLSYRGEDTFASNPWWNFTAFFGAENVNALNWFTTLNTEKYLWAYGAGSGTFVSAGGIGTSTSFGTTDSKAVFCMMLGSYFGDWDNTNNLLRAPLAGTVDGLGLANMWAGRPHWHIHSMAMGETLGHGARRSQNNIGDYSTGFGAAQVHVALMGDPTLRLFPVLPVSALGQAASPGAVVLSWGASTDAHIQGYAIYRGATDAKSTGLFSRVNGELVTGTSFTDLSGVPGTTYTYMVRAVKLETSSSGTYRNSSQGIFIDATPGAVSGPEMSVFGNGEPIQSGSTGALVGNLTDHESGEINVDVISRTFTIKNDGTTDLTLSGASPVSVSGAGATDFLVTAQPGVGVLTSGSSTTFTIEFTPTVLGMREAVVSFGSDDVDEGTFTFAIAGRGIPNIPDISIATTSDSKTLALGASGAETLSISNSGVGDLNFEMMTEYAFRDSDHASGPSYDWIDISTVGTEITSWTGSGAPTDNGGSGSIPIGFNFPFYGTNQSSLRVSTEGFLIFGNWVDAPSNAPSLPSLSAPQNIIAMYWDDLDLRSSFSEADQGRVYTLQVDPDTFIVQYEGVYQYSSSPSTGDERLTCQAILKSSGEIILQYQSVPTTTHYLVGIQNENLDRGLTVAANSSAITDLMAVRILPPIEDSWLALSATSGTTMATLTSDITMTCDPSGLPFGDYFGLLHVISNDPDTPLIVVDLEIEGGDEISEIELTGNGNPIAYQTTTPQLGNDTDFGLVAAGALAQTKTYTITNTGVGDLNLGVLTLAGSDFTLTQPATSVLGAGVSTTFTVTFPTGLAGAYTAIMTVPSDDGNEPSSTFVVQAIKMTPIEGWRLEKFGDITDTTPGDNDGDPDGDGLSNLVEYALGGDPNVRDATEILPTATLDASGRVQINFERDPAKTDLTYTVQASNSLAALSWADIASSVGGAVTMAAPSGAFSVAESGSPEIEVIVTDAETSLGNRFLRLKLSIP